MNIYNINICAENNNLSICLFVLLCLCCCVQVTVFRLLCFGRFLTLEARRHLDGDCKGTVTGSYRNNLDWVWLGGTGSVQSIRAFHALVSPALMGAECISRGFLWGGVYYSAGEILRMAVEKLALLIYVSTTAIEGTIFKSASMLFDVICSA